MKKIQAIVCLFIVCKLSAQYPAVEIPGTEVRKLKSEIVTGQEYELHILLPGSYKASNKKYPVIYLMDAQWDFPLLKSLYGQHYYDGFIPELIIVGVTWGGPSPNHDSLRARDYTPSREQRLLQSGGANNFLLFMKKELFPFIESNYRALDTNRGLMGCSLGGLFTLYTLFTQPDLFTYYAAASPAVGWDNQVLYQAEKAFSENKPAQAKRVYMTIGDVKRSRPVYEKFAAKMKTGNYPFISKILENTGHSGTKSETYSRALQYFFEKAKLTIPNSILEGYKGNYRSEDGLTVELKNENGRLTLYLSPNNRYELYAASNTEFYTNAEFLNLHFNIKNGKADGFRLNRYNQSKYIQKTH